MDNLQDEEGKDIYGLIQSYANGLHVDGGFEIKIKYISSFSHSSVGSTIILKIDTMVVLPFKI